MPLIHCIYASASASELTAEALGALLTHGRAKNERCGITGMLLHIDGDFLQVLEGEEDAVNAIYAQILADPRHSWVTRIITEPIASRRFAEWTMGFSRVEATTLTALVGENDFYRGRLCVTALDDGRAKKIITAFASGRWRRRATSLQPAHSAA